MSYEFVTVDRHDGVLTIGINRPAKANAFNLQTFHELSLAYAELDEDEDARVGVLHAEGRHFTAGMDLTEVAPEVAAGHLLQAAGGIDPWQVTGRRLSKPLIAAVQGKCLTLGVELVLAADFAVCTPSASFAQLEPQIGLFPFGGSTTRLPQRAGWGNAMRWLLTCEEYGADEALRLGVVQEIVSEGHHLERALELAARVARHPAPAVAAVLQNARLSVRHGEAAAEADMLRLARTSFTSPEGEAGIAAFAPRPRERAAE